ncbi:MAG: hypothetical protein LBE92_07250 [Chryseobacterium sp.]|jgi:hypothetical protein|uniref:hypothetical protein n=1 Tax=Chryseobacterium sp. TaxID=1871047 RepID=UPI002825504C|nr:hypothetical protein [Chryseobacterium sp.]MDR2235904.1 hypothetical protein [Chryseobacterium sp.]
MQLRRVKDKASFLLRLTKLLPSPQLFALNPSLSAFAIKNKVSFFADLKAHAQSWKLIKILINLNRRMFQSQSSELYSEVFWKGKDDG